jgi:MoaA/NifB/PqqE/SkfB family radical SAM enzyme
MRRVAAGVTMNYQIEADWHLLNTCNYRCAYCFFPPAYLGSKLQTFAEPEQWRRAYDATGYIWLLHITGGEPSVYPDFVNLCEGLTKKHFISVNSNLSNRAFLDFADRIDPSRVSFINAGLHLEERERRSGNAVFLANAELLHAKKFRTLISLVGSPSALARFEDAILLLAPLGLFPVPKLLRGNYQGKKYPGGYSDLDRERFRKFARLARAHYQPMLAGGAERPTIDMFHDDDLLDGVPSFRGQSCEAGRLFVRIDANGDIFRCGTSDRIGNVLEGEFERTAGPAACDTSYCFYFCQKYAQPRPAAAALLSDEFQSGRFISNMASGRISK